MCVIRRRAEDLEQLITLDPSWRCIRDMPSIYQPDAPSGQLSAGWWKVELKGGGIAVTTQTTRARIPEVRRFIHVRASRRAGQSRT